MKLNLTKSNVKAIFLDHPGEWFTTKEIASIFKAKTKREIDRISNILYRMRHDPNIQRQRCSPHYEYRYLQHAFSESTKTAKSVKPTKENGLKTLEKKKKVIDGGSDGYDRYTDVELLPEPEESYCEECGDHTTISFKGEKNGHAVFLCERHGIEVDKFLYSGNGRFEQ